MANTATPHQPLSSHPIPYFMKRILGGGAGLFTGLLPETDTLVIPPPPPSPNGVVARLIDLDTAFKLLNSSGIEVIDVDAPNFQLIYKNASAEESILVSSSSALPSGEAEDLTPEASFLLGPTDLGIYLRILDIQEDGPVPFTGSLDGYVSYFDVRDIHRSQFDLTTEFQTVLTGEQGKMLFFTRVGEEGSRLTATVANFDSIAHTIEARLSDGVITIPLPHVASSPIDIGTVGQLGLSYPPTLSLLEGWTLDIRTTVDAATRPCRLLLGHTDTNLSPVRTNQGGAY